MGAMGPENEHQISQWPDTPRVLIVVVETFLFKLKAPSI